MMDAFPDVTGKNNHALPPLKLKNRLKKLQNEKYKRNLKDLPDADNEVDGEDFHKAKVAALSSLTDTQFAPESLEIGPYNKRTNVSFEQSFAKNDQHDYHRFYNHTSGNSKENVNEVELDNKDTTLTEEILLAKSTKPLKDSERTRWNESSVSIRDDMQTENGNDTNNKELKDFYKHPSHKQPTTPVFGDSIDNNMVSDELDPVESKPDYRLLALDLAVNGTKKTAKHSKKYCDFVLVYDSHSEDVYNVTERDHFEQKLKTDGLELFRTEVGSHVFVEVYASFDRLCKEAEFVCLQMPLKEFILEPNHRNSLFKDCFKSFKTDNEVDMVSAPFCYSSKEIFHGIENTKTFFRSAHRSMLIYHILANTKLESSSDNTASKTGLNALLHSGSYKDAFILHERSEYDSTFPKKAKIKSYNMASSSVDSRKELHDTWLKLFKFQPLWKIRNYYGEKIALYFAWLGVLVSSLSVPVLLGFVVFIFGIVTAFPKDKDKLNGENFQKWMSAAFDNDATPGFAFLICLWGTVFLELWKRKNATLAYKWDVDSFEEQEPNRPQFYGTRLLKDPVSGSYEPYYPLWRKVLKSMGSISVVIFMVLLVLTSVVSVIVYKVISRVDWFASMTNGETASSLTSSVLNSISILLLGWFYKKLAYKLTDWENHQTRTKYEDALILKLFGFQFINSYASLVYIAFFRERTASGIFSLSSEYSDSCGVDNDCMSLLSLQVAVLMISKPMPKLFSDLILPFLLRSLKKVCCCIKSHNRVTNSERQLQSEFDNDDLEYESYLNAEYRRPDLGDFTLTEYTEKVLQYGYLMLFAAAFPLAPLIALLTNIIDMRVDARRMLWFNRRPVPQRAQDIGMWFTILSFLNYCGMITNALIIGLTSRFGRKYQSTTKNYPVPGNMTLLNVPINSSSSLPFSSFSNSTTGMLSISVTTYDNLWIIIIFENAVLAIKFLLAYAIPDVPEKVSRAQKQEKNQLEKLLSRCGLKRGPGNSITKRTSNLQADEATSETINQRESLRRSHKRKQKTADAPVR